MKICNALYLLSPLDQNDPAMYKQAVFSSLLQLMKMLLLFGISKILVYKFHIHTQPQLVYAVANSQ